MSEKMDMEPRLAALEERLGALEAMMANKDAEGADEEAVADAEGEEKDEAVKDSKSVSEKPTKAETKKEEGEETTDAAEGESEGETAEQAEAAEGEEPEKEYKEVKVPHQFPVAVEEELHGARVLTKDQLKAAKDRIKALEKRDTDKRMTDEAKNSYESLIYEFRAWLREEANEKYVTEEDREAKLAMLEEAEDWLYEAGADVGYKTYQEKQYGLMADKTKFDKRREEHLKREEKVPQIMESLDESRTRGHEIREHMPWVTETEQNDLIEKIEETRDWLEKKLEEQSQVSLTEDPVFKWDDVEAKMKKLNTMAKKIFGKKKPKEKKPKKEEEAKKAEGDDAGEQKTDESKSADDETHTEL